MKKFLLSAFALAVAVSASAFQLGTTKNNLSMNPTLKPIQKAPTELVDKMVKKSMKEKAQSMTKVSAPTKASDLVGGYSWSYSTSDGWGVDPDTVEITGTYTDNVIIYDANDTENTYKIAGMFIPALTGSLDFDTYSAYNITALVIESGQVCYIHPSYGNCTLTGVFYYEGDDTYEAGWYGCDLMAYVNNNGEIEFMQDTWFGLSIIYQGQSYIISDIYRPGSTMSDKASVNAIMEYGYENLNWAVPMELTQNNYIATMTNFGGVADNPVNIYLGSDKSWVAEPSVLYTENDTLNYTLVGLTADTSVVYLTGTGTETVLTFDTDWTGIDLEGSGYWMGKRGAATITLIGGEFIYPDPIPDVYILGEVGENTWAPNVGQQMTRDEETGLYTAEITCDGRNEGYNYFSFTTKLADNADDWASIANYRFGAVSEATDENPNGDFYVTEEMFGTDLALQAGQKAFRVPGGTYNLTVNYADMKLKIEKVAAPIKLGDANCDGKIDVNDVTTTINYILKKNPNPFSYDNANVNGDDTVSVLDVTLIIDMILHPNNY